MQRRGRVYPVKPPPISRCMTWRHDLQVRCNRFAREESIDAEIIIPGNLTRWEIEVALTCFRQREERANDSRGTSEEEEEGRRRGRRRREKEEGGNVPPIHEIALISTQISTVIESQESPLSSPCPLPPPGTKSPLPNSSTRFQTTPPLSAPPQGRGKEDVRGESIRSVLNAFALRGYCPKLLNLPFRHSKSILFSTHYSSIDPYT